ncbi:MAG: hypothetical protein ACRERU_13570 [Methylococcales bacterium]
MIDLFALLPGLFANWFGIQINSNPRIVINVVAVLMLLFFVFYVVQALRAIDYLGRAVRLLENVWRKKSAVGIITKND